MTVIRTWLEFECPICGLDQDVEPPPALGEAFRCSNCDRTFQITAENSQVGRLDEGGEITFHPPAEKPPTV